MEHGKSRIRKNIGTVAVVGIIALTIITAFYVGMSDDSSKTIVPVPIDTPRP